MQKTLAILEVSQKQSYIFSSNHLQENVERSNEIAYVTGEGKEDFGDFFSDVAGSFYKENDNLIYAGGGHAVFQFDTKEQAKAFVQAVTLRAMQTFPGMEVFAALLDTAAYPDKTPGDLLKMLSEKLEKKKSVRAASFRRTSLGVEKLDNITWLPCRAEKNTDQYGDRFRPADRRDFKDLLAAKEGESGRGNFIAVVHIDGNGMGARVMSIYGKTGRDWDACCRSLRAFSDGIKHDFEDAFSEMEKELAALGYVDSKNRVRLRKVITAGDDICFVCDGRIGLLAAKIFLEKITKKENCEQRGLPYSACAGVALVHTKYPFHMAYDLSEELCSNAKRFGARLDEDSRISALDWHVEFGQLKGGLGEQRADYLCEDSTAVHLRHMELRPLTVVVPDDLKEKVQRETFGLRSWDYFSRVFGMLVNSKTVARSKLKNLRNAIRQGEIETCYYLRETRSENALAALVGKAAGGEEMVRADLSCRFVDEDRSLVFDAIELLDVIDLGEEERKQ